MGAKGRPLKRVIQIDVSAGLTAWGAAGERQECDVTCTLDRYGNRALVSRAGSQLASWLDLAALTDVSAQAGEILVVNVSDVIGAVLANLASGAKTSASTATAWSARTATTLAAFAAAAALGTAKAAGAGLSLFCILRISHSSLPSFLFCVPRRALRLYRFRYRRKGTHCHTAIRHSHWNQNRSPGSGRPGCCHQSFHPGFRHLAGPAVGPRDCQ